MRLFYILIILLVPSTTSAQLSGWIWARSGTGSANDYGNKVAYIGNGCVVAGTFTSDTLIIGADTLLNAGSGTPDAFIARYNYLGIPLWARSLGSGGAEEALDIVVGGVGQIFITGYFTSDTITIGATDLVNTGSTTKEMFVASFDQLGNPQWAKSMGGPGNESGRGMAAQSTYLCVTGYYESSNILFAGDTLSPVDSTDIFLIKYDVQGNELWARSIGGSGNETGNDVGINYPSTIYVTGSFQSDTLYTVYDTLVNRGESDGILAKYDASGTMVWAKSFGGNRADEGNALQCTSYQPSLYLAGSFSSDSLYFDGDTLYNFDAFHSKDAFFIQLDSSGTSEWSQTIGGSGDETATDLDYGAYLYDQLYVTGTSESPSIQVGQYNLTGNGGSDVFVVALHMSFVNWATMEGSSLDEHSNGICATFNQFYCTGSFESPNVSLDTCQLYNSGGSDVFTARYTFPSGIATIENPEQQLLIYPNPTSGIFAVQLPEDAQQLQITDIAGRLIISRDVPGDATASFELPVTGMYFVTVSTPAGKVTGKIICTE